MNGDHMKGSDWAIRVLERSLNDENIAPMSQRFALQALSAHGRLVDVPQAWKTANARVWESYERQAA